MSRRIFLNSGNFASASLIFTKVIWQKEQPFLYRNTGMPVNGNGSRLYHTLSILHSIITGLKQKKERERRITINLEYISNQADQKNAAAILIYEVISSDLVRRETILTESVDVYRLKARLLSFMGDLQMHTGLTEMIEFTIKQGLSATIAGEQELYLPYHVADKQTEEL